MSAYTDKSVYEVGKPIELFVIVENEGSKLSVEPVEPLSFETMLVDSRATAVAARRGYNDLNTTGISGYELNRGDAIKNHLRLDYRYGLQPGMYKLTVSLDVYEGTSFPAR